MTIVPTTTVLPRNEDAAAAWQSPSLLPANPLANQWGALHGGDIVPISLADLMSMLRLGPGPVLWNGKPQNEVPVFVAPPGAPRLVPMVERSEFQSTVLETNEAQYAESYRNQGLLFLGLSLLCAMFLGVGVPRLALFPAIYAAGAGARFLQAWMALRQIRQQPATYLASLAAEARYAYWLNTHTQRQPWHTYGLVAGWLLVAAVEAHVASMHGRDRLEAAALVKPLVPTEPWRLLTGPMMHGSLMHILMNVIATMSLGYVLERTVHRYLTMPIWLLGAVCGSLFSWAATSTTSVGASGGLMALFGFLLVMAWRRDGLLPPDFRQGFLRSLLVTALFGALAWQVIDNAAHAGGLLAGMVMGGVAFRSASGSLPWKGGAALRIVGAASVVIFVGLTVFTAGKLMGWV